MRIFIYAQGRSGSNTIVKALIETLNHSFVWDKDFNNELIPHDTFEKVIQKDNITIKLHPGQRTNIFDNDIEFLKYIKTKFDHIIFHGRANAFDVGLSIENGFKITDYSWVQNKYTPVADRPSIDHIRHASLKLADLVLYARTFGKDLTFYEEIFSGNKELTINTINRWGIDSNLLSYDILLERFNPKHKYTNKK